MDTASTKLTVEEFWALPAGETNYELVDGAAIPKVSPKYHHSALQFALLRLFDSWCKGKGRILPEWSVTLQRNGVPWVPTPGLTYVSYKRLPESWDLNEACPVPCDLAIEIISPGQTFSEFEQKGCDYFAADVRRVWIIDPGEKSVSVMFSSNYTPKFIDERAIVDILLPGLELTPRLIFKEARLIKD